MLLLGALKVPHCLRSKAWKWVQGCFPPGTAKCDQQDTLGMELCECKEPGEESQRLVVQVEEGNWGPIVDSIWPKTLGCVGDHKPFQPQAGKGISKSLEI